MQIEQLKPIIEAALLAASQPLSIAQLGELFVEEDEVDRAQIAMALEQLAEDCQGRGVELKEVASGFRYQIRHDVHPWVSRMWTEKPSRYSRALLETLALIAYRQPITRPEIEQIRGVVVSSNIIKTLEEREWVRVVGHRDVPGKPALFGTTRAFLDYFNLKSLDELPPLSEIRDMEDPQLRLDNDSPPPRPVRDLPIDPDAEEAESETFADQAHTAHVHTEEEHALEEQSHEEHVDAEDNHTPSDEALLDEGQERPKPSLHQEEETADAPSHPDESADEANAVEETKTHPATADEAANPADAAEGTAEQDTEEYRA
ncbi:SMC-Scp complex subunit ScpB [Dyella nitratireducens]|uniref:Segregation and condensation protein B n=1 Tax=Dyella nitratireducens TaxID=1849580 RepID=A0ABQ1GH25_9GAMM|nr:SMC-Scp complex subunit ScpB [Dyella nitratireducens]GGA43518.1 segregation and condensation protein B [Dyella nitratireducens]GLQ41861.1 segregation and condensation protein B [Dyella nitratireducens]